MNNSTKSTASVDSGAPAAAQVFSSITGIPVDLLSIVFDGDGATDEATATDLSAKLEEVRIAQLKDELLFKQPESSHLGDCPICFLPIPIITTQDIMRYSTFTCCSNIVCDGCIYANGAREHRMRLPHACPFCRHPVSETDEEDDRSLMGRIKVNDPLALHDAALKRFNEGDYATAAEYWGKAAGLGHIDSHYKLSALYDQGHGVEKDTKKAVYHLEKAAIGGHPTARHNLGVCEDQRGFTFRAANHFIIAANLGFDGSLKTLRKFYQEGKVSKENFAAALRAYQAAVDAAKSPQRVAAEEKERRNR